MFPTIYQWLAASGSVTSIAGDRLYFNIAPQQLITSPKQAFVVWMSKGGLPQNYVDQAPGIDNFEFEIHCYAPSEEVATSLGEAVRAVLEQWGQSTSSAESHADWETKLHAITLTFSFWRNRA